MIAAELAEVCINSRSFTITFTLATEERWVGCWRTEWLQSPAVALEIGRAIAVDCARHGAKLVLHHIGDKQSVQDIEELKTELLSLRGSQHNTANEVDIAIDVTDNEAGKRIVEVAVATFGEINAIVHNAGIAQFTGFPAVSKIQLDKHLAVNLAGPFTINQAVCEQMIKQGKGGSIVSIASVCATVGSADLTHYAASKAAILGMTVSCAVALGKHGIRFNAVSPGTIETALNKKDLEGAKRGIMTSRVPLGRLGVPVDIAGPVVFLLSDLSQYVSGQNLIADGAGSVYYQ